MCLVADGERITASRKTLYVQSKQGSLSWRHEWLDLYHATRADCITVARELPCPSWQLALTGSLLQLACLGSVVVSWIVVCGHVLSRSLIMSWVCDHFLACGLWSYPGWVCGHLLDLWSFPGSWSVVMSWVGLWSSSGSVVISWIVDCGHFLGLWSSPESVVISCVVVCNHALGGSVVIS